MLRLIGIFYIWATFVSSASPESVLLDSAVYGQMISDQTASMAQDNFILNEQLSTQISKNSTVTLSETENTKTVSAESVKSVNNSEARNQQSNRQLGETLNELLEGLNDEDRMAVVDDNVPEFRDEISKNRQRSLIFAAAQLGSPAIIERFIQSNRVNLVTEDGFTPLLVSMINYNFEVASILLDAGADPTIRADHGERALDYASLISDSQVRQQLKEAALRAEPDTFLLDASRTGDVATLHQALVAGASADATTQDGHSALYLAANAGHTSIIEVLLQAQADPDVLGPEGATPLSMAVMNGHQDVLKLLLKAGAEPDLTEGQAPRPLMLAILTEQPDLARLLLDHGAQKSVIEGEDASPKSVASLVGLEELTERLDNSKRKVTHADLLEAAKIGREALEKTVSSIPDDVDVKELLAQTNDEGLSAFHVAAMSGNGRTLSYLFSYAVEVPSTQVADGANVLALMASEIEYGSIVRMFTRYHESELKRQARQKDELGNTPLHRAMIAGNDAVVRRILDKVDVSTIGENGDGLEPLQLAVLQGSGKYVRWIIETSEAGRLSEEKLTVGEVSLQDIARSRGDWAVLAALPEDMVPPVQLDKNSDRNERKSFQRWLKRLGYYDGAVDGILGGGSAAAMRAFLEDRKQEMEAMASAVLQGREEYESAYTRAIYFEWNNGATGRFTVRTQSQNEWQDDWISGFFGLILIQYYEHPENRDFLISAGRGVHNSFVLDRHKSGIVAIKLTDDDGFATDLTLKSW